MKTIGFPKGHNTITKLRTYGKIEWHYDSIEHLNTPTIKQQH